MSPPKSKPYKLKNSRSSTGDVVADSLRRRPPMRTASTDAEFEELRKTIKLASGIKPPPTREHGRWNSIVKFFLDLEEDPTLELTIFPRYAIWFLMLLAAYSRYLITNGVDGMTIIHPDEHLPTVEAAHIKVYGYGLNINRSLYIDPVNGTEVSTTSGIHRQIYIFLFRLRQQFGLEHQPFLLARYFHVVVAAFTPWCVYQFTRMLFSQCRDVAFMAANLVAFSKHLLIYAIHPLSQSLFSPLVFLAITVLYKSWTSENSVIRSLILLVCGLIFGLVIYIQADTLIHLFLIFILVSPSAIVTKVQYLPTSLRVTSVLTVIIGAVLGLQFGVGQDRRQRREWRFTPLELLKFRFENNPNFVVSMISFRGFLSGNHVHWALMVSAFLCSLIYLSYKQRWTELFDPWLNSHNNAAMFKITSKLTLTVCILLLYSVHPHQFWFTHDTLVLFLLAGSSAVYLLYRGLYIYIATIANPKKTTKNVIKLIVYGELFLYMFESRLTFPNSGNQSIAEWSHKEVWESSPVNWCLKFVSQQPDVYGLFLDFPAEMSGGYSLLHKKVPVISVIGNKFAEWNPKEQKISNVFSLHNPHTLMKYVVNETNYNYFVITGNRKFFNHGFRKVYNVSNTRVYKRSKSFTERQRLEEDLKKLSLPFEVSGWLDEISSLIRFNLFETAAGRLRLLLEKDPTVEEAWKLLIYTSKKVNRENENFEVEVLKKCQAVLEGPKCTDQGLNLDSFGNNSHWNITYRFI